MFSHEGLSRVLFLICIASDRLSARNLFRARLGSLFSPVSQVDEDAFTTLEECIAFGDFDVCESVPAGDEAGSLANPVAAFAVDMAGPARYEKELNALSLSLAL